MSTHDNRRAFMRHDDDILLRLRKIDRVAFDTIVEDYENWRLDYSFGEDRTQSRRHLQPAFRKIESEMPEVAAYLLKLEQRMDELTRQLDTERSANDAGTPSRANLSAQGIRCRSRTEVSGGDLVEVGMILLPQKEQIVALGEVIAQRTELGQGHLHDLDQLRAHRLPRQGGADPPRLPPAARDPHDEAPRGLTATGATSPDAAKAIDGRGGYGHDPTSRGVVKVNHSH